MDIARLAFAGGSVAHCWQPAWEAGEHLSRSAPASIGVSFTTQSCVVESGGRAATRLVGAGTMVVMADAAGWLRVDAASEVVEISAGPDLRRALADELGVPGQAELAMLDMAADPVTWAIAARLRAAIRGGWPSTSIGTETLVRTVYARLLRHCFGGRLRERGNGALDERRLARVADYVEAFLATPLGLSDLAEVASLSPFHFQRAFRRATGISPHRYVALRRAQRALEASRHSPSAAPERFGYRDVRMMQAGVWTATGIQLPRAPRTGGSRHSGLPSLSR